MDIDVPDHQHPHGGQEKPVESVVETPEATKVFVPNSTGNAAGTKKAEVAEKEEEWSTHGVMATPAVRRIARENNVDLSKVKGTGKEGVGCVDALCAIELHKRSADNWISTSYSEF